LKLKIKSNAFYLALYLVLTLVGCSSGQTVTIPNFPHNTEEKVIRQLALFYSPDDISASTSLKDLGYPNDYLFMLHQDHPQLKITMQTVPSNRYIVDDSKRDIVKISEADFDGTCCRTLWKMIMYDEMFTSWMELGNHGYTHSPPGDENLDHHEFSSVQDGCNFDHSLTNTIGYCNERLKLAREAYHTIGLDNNKILVMRFPGFAYTDAALRALLDNGFIAFFGAGSCGKAEWITLSDGREILNIPSTSLYSFYDGEYGNSYFQDCLDNGGIINLFDHWWDMFEKDSVSTYRNYQIISDNLHYVEEKYADQVWWSFGSEMALWQYFKKNVNISWQSSDTQMRLKSTVPNWNPDWGAITASYSITFDDERKINKILYSTKSDAWQELSGTMYWQEGQYLYLNVPFNGHLEMEILSEE
jgi:hypothetical protein